MWNCPPRHLTVTIVLHHITMMQKIAIDPFDKNLSRTNQISLFARKLNENAFYIADWKWRNKKGGGGGGNQASQCQFLWLYYPCLNAIYVEPDFPPTRQKTEYLSNREKYTAFFTPLFCIIFRFESVVVNRSLLLPPRHSNFVRFLWQFTCILMYSWLGERSVRIKCILQRKPTMTDPRVEHFTSLSLKKPARLTVCHHFTL